MASFTDADIRATYLDPRPWANTDRAREEES